MPKVDQARAAAKDLRAKLRQLDKIIGKDSERERDAERKRVDRAAARIVIIPPCVDRDRREILELDDIDWLMYYFAPESGCEAPFTYTFTEQQREMIAAIRNAILEGGDQAIAASRGEGKTTLCERLLLKYTLQGLIRFSVLFAATGSAAENSLDSIKGEIEVNERLAEDYPEVCTPVRALENTPNRAHYQIVSGVRHDNGQPFEAASSKFSWCGQEIIFPKVPGSPSTGAIIATRGLDSAVRGLKKKGRRVDVAVIDDPDTEDTARSEEQAKKLEDRIDRSIAGLGSQKRPVSRVMLTTLQNRICVSFRFTDAKAKQSWHGRRFRFLVSPPAKPELWEEYISLLHADWQHGTRNAHEFYVANRAAMDEGAEVANPNRYTKGELSALQHYYNLVARIGAEAVATEYDNDPPADDVQDVGITAYAVRTKLNLIDRRIVPAGCKALTAAIDLGMYKCHWTVIAWLEGATGLVIDYGDLRVHNLTAGNDEKKAREGTEKALLAEMLQWKETWAAEPYCTLDGREKPLDLCFVDSGHWDTAVYAFVRMAGGRFQASKGFGASVKSPFSSPASTTTKTQAGNHWYRRFQDAHRVYLYGLDADYWKRFVQERFMTPTFNDEGDLRRGALSLWGGTERDHMAYSYHIVAEIEEEKFIPGKGLKRQWRIDSKQNHWLDATYMACAAADVMGVRLMADAPKPAQSLAEMAKAAKRSA